jgi:hypothetical protein
MSDNNRNGAARKRKKRLVKDAPLTRAAYEALDGTSRKLVDYARRSLAEGLAQSSNTPFATALQSVTRLHEHGHLKMVLRGDRIDLLPRLEDGTVIHGFYNFGADRGGRS